ALERFAGQLLPLRLLLGREQAHYLLVNLLAEGIASVLCFLLIAAAAPRPTTLLPRIRLEGLDLLLLLVGKVNGHRHFGVAEGLRTLLLPRDLFGPLELVRFQDLGERLLVRLGPFFLLLLPLFLTQVLIRSAGAALRSCQLSDFLHLVL